MQSSGDFFAQYKAISAKLKKRFLRKPNVAEASTEFYNLARELENAECPHYAAFCCLAVARCEHSVGNTVFEAQHLIHAARLFLQTEMENHKLLCPSWSEYLQAAISTYGDAIQVYLDTEQFALAASLYLELARALRDLNRDAEAAIYYLKAADLHRACPIELINDLRLVSDCRIKIRDYYGALMALDNVQDICERRGFNSDGERMGAFSDILSEVEVTRLLLILYLQPPELKMDPAHKKLLDQYSDILSDPVPYIKVDLYMLLQSLTLCVQQKEITALREMEKDLWPLLNHKQCDILIDMLDQYKDMALKLPLCESVH